MSFDMTTPNIPNYLERLRQIQQVIVPESAVAWTPSEGAGNYPYWLTLAKTITQAVSTQASNITTLTVDMFLVRGGVSAGYDGQLEMLVMQDMANVLSYFKRHQDLCTTQYPSIQNYYVPGSAILSRIERVEGTLQGGQAVIGSQYTLQFRHILQKTNASVATPT